VQSRDVLMDAFGRLPDLVSRAVDGLSATQLIWAPVPGANSVGWLAWHLTRIQDSHVAELLTAPQLWETGEWASHFGLSPDPSNTGYGHDAADVASVQPDSDMALTGYYADVWDRTATFIQSLSDDDLNEIVDRNWNPPVTLGVRLVSVLGDCTQHVGQAAYVRGLLPI
jgi:hypothetical protein